VMAAPMDENLVDPDEIRAPRRCRTASKNLLEIDI
jgi:hypothetical protein